MKPLSIMLSRLYPPLKEHFRNWSPTISYSRKKQCSGYCWKAIHVLEVVQMHAVHLWPLLMFFTSQLAKFKGCPW